jgi:hypothetical protein
VVAQRQVDAAGFDDAAYDRAIVALETAMATTLPGVKAQMGLFVSRFESLVEGDELTASGLEMMWRLPNRLTKPWRACSARPARSQ